MTPWRFFWGQFHKRTQFQWFLDSIWKQMDWVGHPPQPLQPGQIACITTIRDERGFLDRFVEHHLDIGIDRIILIDNGSTDGSLEAAVALDRVSVLQTGLDYQTWKAFLPLPVIQRIAPDNWVVTLDMDELLRLPADEPDLKLPEFTDYLQQSGASAVVAHMLDMFRPGPIDDQSPERIQNGNWHWTPEGLVSTSIADEIRWGRNRYLNPEIRFLRGGARKLQFGTSPLLSKVPLFRSGTGVQRLGIHRVRCAVYANVNCILQHFLINSNLYRKVRRESRQVGWQAGEFYGSVQFPSGEQQIVVDIPGSRPFTNVADLESTEFLRVSDDYRRWLTTRRTGKKKRPPDKSAGAFGID